MTQYNKVNENLSNSQLNKCESEIKNEADNFKSIIKYCW